MKIQFFAIYDEKACAYMCPLKEQNKLTALRAFSLTCEKQDTMFYQHPEDFSIFYVGDFDDNTGIFTSLEKPELLAKATEFVKKGEDNAKVSN